MSITELRKIYNDILSSTASEEDEKSFLLYYLNSGGMSVEWFYSNLTEKVDDPTTEELEVFMQIIRDLAVKY